MSQGPAHGKVGPAAPHRRRAHGNAWGQAAMEIKGKLALVTGASSGIGAATARALAAEGARLVLVARSADRLEALAGELRAQGTQAWPLPADLSRPETVARMGEQALAQAGVPDLLVNNAGAGRWLSVLETEPEEARAMMELPYLAAFGVSRALLPAMLVRGSGFIVNVTSPASYLAWPHAAAYIAARHALKGFSEGLRLEIEDQGVGVGLVVLGTVESSYWAHNPGSRAHVPIGPAPLTTAQAAQAILAAIRGRRRLTVRPWVFRLLFALEALAPGLAARGARRGS